MKKILIYTLIVLWYNLFVGFLFFDLTILLRMDEWNAAWRMIYALWYIIIIAWFIDEHEEAKAKANDPLNRLHDYIQSWDHWNDYIKRK